MSRMKANREDTYMPTRTNVQSFLGFSLQLHFKHFNQLQHWNSGTVDSQVLNVIRIHVRLRPFLYCTQVSKFIVKCAIGRRNAEVTIGYMEDQQFSTTLSLEHRSPDC